MKYFVKIIKCVGIIIGIIVAICFVGYFAWALWFVANFHGDSYKDAEPYVVFIENKEKDARASVDFLYQFQSVNPEFRLITTNRNGELYHNFSAIDGTYPDLIFFYFKDIDKTISCIVETSTKNKFVIKLYAVSEGVNFASWERINNYKEISREENERIKKKFETEILDKLGVKWKHKRW